MSMDAFVIETPDAVGIVIREGRVFRFVASHSVVASLNDRIFPSVGAAEAAAWMLVAPKRTKARPSQPVLA